MMTSTPGGSTPVPDPTELTSRAVALAVGQIRLDMAGLRELLEARLDAMDKATDLHRGLTAEVTGRAERQTAHLKELLETHLDDVLEYVKGQIELGRAETGRVLDVCMERFSAIDGTFASNALALTAALAAQKEAAAEQNKSGTLAITKSEQTTKETINSNAIQTSGQLASQAALITDVKERVVRLEQSVVNTATNRIEGRDDRTEHRGDRQSVTALAAVGLSAVAIIVAVFLGNRNNESAATTSTNLPPCSTAAAGVECITTK